MSDWDSRWAAHEHESAPPRWLEELPAGVLGERGRALDVASGAGRIGLWLARRGFDVTAADLSRTGLTRAAEAARAEGLAFRTCLRDLESEPLPEGPWDVITCFQYLQRSLFAAFAESLAPGGVLVCEIATSRNLERHAHPSARFLLDEGELPRLCAPLESLWSREGWHDGRALARIVARKV